MRPVAPAPPADRGPVALIMQRVSTAVRSGSLLVFPSPWSATTVRWSVPAFLLRMPGGAPPLGDPLLFRLQRVMTYALGRKSPAGLN